jgi:hypothetical protein
VAEGDGLENRCGRESTVGSNPTLSARYFALSCGFPRSAAFRWVVFWRLLIWSVAVILQWLRPKGIVYEKSRLLSSCTLSIPTSGNRCP